MDHLLLCKMKVRDGPKETRRKKKKKKEKEKKGRVGGEEATKQEDQIGGVWERETHYIYTFASHHSDFSIHLNFVGRGLFLPASVQGQSA